MQQGLIELYCGDGKGKTTAALGLILRASGRGLKVLLCQFLKGRVTGELNSLALLPQVKILRGKALTKFTFQMNEAEKLQVLKDHQNLLQQARELCQNGQVDLLVLDEAVGACALALLDEESLLDFLAKKPAGMEIVLTGRNPSPKLLASADYVSEIKKRKHPFDKGITAREGIEY